MHPGETLMCQGCHEPKRRAPYPADGTPLAMQRPPSIIEPDVQGSNPFNYVQLVQDVLDRNCVECHQQEKALDLSGDIADLARQTDAFAASVWREAAYGQEQHHSDA